MQPKYSVRAGMIMGLAVTLAACGESRPLTSGGSDVARVTLSLQQQDNGGGTLLLDPRTATIHVGHQLLVNLKATDEDGNVIPDVKASWRSTHPIISGVTPFPDSTKSEGARARIAGISEGTARIIVTYQGIADTAVITVAPARNDGGTDSTNSPPPPRAMTTFEVGVYLSTSVDTTLLANWSREPVASATVRLVRLPRPDGDVVPVGVPNVTQPTLFETAVSNADGFVIFTQVPTGPFRIEVQPAEGTAWLPTQATYGTPFFPTIRTSIRVEKN